MYPPQPPYHYQQPPFMPFHVRTWRKYRSLKKKTQMGIAGVVLFWAFIICVGTANGIVNVVAPPAQTTTQHHNIVTSTHSTAPPASKSTTIPIPPTATPIVQPTTQPPTPTQPPTHTGVNGNPWGYDFYQGSLIYNPPANFCTYFTCISTFWKDTNGYVAQCGNNKYTHSGGIKGACSRNGGVAATLYQH